MDIESFFKSLEKSLKRTIRKYKKTSLDDLLLIDNCKQTISYKISKVTTENPSISSNTLLEKIIQYNNFQKEHYLRENSKFLSISLPLYAFAISIVLPVFVHLSSVYLLNSYIGYNTAVNFFTSYIILFVVLIYLAILIAKVKKVSCKNLKIQFILDETLKELEKDMDKQELSKILVPADSEHIVSLQAEEINALLEEDDKIFEDEDKRYLKASLNSLEDFEEYNLNNSDINNNIEENDTKNNDLEIDLSFGENLFNSVDFDENLDKELHEYFSKALKKSLAKKTNQKTNPLAEEQSKADTEAKQKGTKKSIKVSEITLKTNEELDEDKTLSSKKTKSSTENNEKRIKRKKVE